MKRPRNSIFNRRGRRNLFVVLANARTDITVIGGGAIEPGLHAATHAFEKETGHRVKITFNTAPQIAKRVAAGDVFDVITSPPVGIEQFAKDGKVGASDRVNVGKVGLAGKRGSVSGKP